MELMSLVLDGPNNPRDEPIADALRRAAETDAAWQPFLQRLIEVVSFLESCKPSVRLYTLLLSGPPRLAIRGPNKASVTLWVDHFDRRKVDLHSGLHFRMQIARDGSTLTHDSRTAEMGEVARQIRLAFNLREI